MGILNRTNIFLFFLIFFLLIWARVDANNNKSLPIQNIHTATLSPTPTLIVPALPQQLIIPKLNINVPVEAVSVDLEGKMTLPQNWGIVGWDSLGVKPGEKGNAAIAGHFDTYEELPAIFYNLKSLEIGDQIHIVDKNNKQYNFIVTDKQIYPYDQAPINKIFGKADNKNLNLITCDGWFNQLTQNYSHRLVIFSKLIE